jgi:hypothetical protein
MTLDKVKSLEIKPDGAGFYFVTLFQYNKKEPKHPEYFQDWLEFDGEDWDYYGEYKHRSLVCIVHKKLKPTTGRG